MKILLKEVSITDVASPHNNTSKDLLIENGIIKTIAKSIQEPGATVLAIPELHVSQGWVDFKSGLKDPGFDEGGGILAGLDAAAKGGFTHIGVLPSDEPTTDMRSGIEYKLRVASHHAVKIHPIGAISKGRKGQSLAEMADMCEAGTRWFSDNRPLSMRLMVQALLYGKDLNARIAFPTYSREYSHFTHVNEGKASTLTGLLGHPSFDEKIEVMKAIETAKYTGVHIHLTGISALESLPLIATAKKEGVPLSCDVHLMNLCCSQERVLDFDTRFKTKPVLRAEEDRLALVAALKGGVIDAVVSDHQAVITDTKRVPFDEAESGTLQFQTAYGALRKYSGLTDKELIELLSVRNRTTFGIQMNPVDVHSVADLTLYQPNQSNIQAEEIPKELSPFAGSDLPGKIVGIIRGSQLVLND